VHEDVDVADLAREPLHVVDVAEIGSNEARLATGRGDLRDRLGAARGVAAMNENLGPFPGKLDRYRATDAGRRARDQRPLSLEVVLADRFHRVSFVRHVFRRVATSDWAAHRTRA